MGILPQVLADADLTVPIGWLPAIAGAAIAALGLLYRNQRQESAERHAEVVALTREVTAALTQNNAALRELTTCVQSLANMVQETKRG